MQLLHKCYFVVAGNTNEQFFYFASLAAWLLSLSGVKIDPPGQFDDPNATVAAIVIELRNLNLECDMSNSKLRAGYGDAVVGALQALADHALRKKTFAHPTFQSEEVIEEAVADVDAEIVADADFSSDEETTPIVLSSPKKGKVISQNADEVIDSQDWYLEVERVTPLLKIQLDQNHKDWRLHLQSFADNSQNVAKTWASTKPRVDKINGDINAALEKINSREKYLSSNYEAQISQHKLLQEELNQIKQQLVVGTEKTNALSTELAQISEELDAYKTRMDEFGSGMTDAKPLVSIKQALARLKAEIKEMDLRRGVIEHSLLHGRLAHKRYYFGVDRVGGLVTSTTAAF